MGRAVLPPLTQVVMPRDENRAIWFSKLIPPTPITSIWSAGLFSVLPPEGATVNNHREHARDAPAATGCERRTIKHRQGLGQLYLDFRFFVFGSSAVDYVTSPLQTVVPKSCRARRLTRKVVRRSRLPTPESLCWRSAPKPATQPSAQSANGLQPAIGYPSAIGNYSQPTAYSRRAYRQPSAYSQLLQADRAS